MPSGPHARVVSLAAVLVAAAIGDMAAQAPARGPAPLRLAVYYGIPSLVNGAAGNVERAAAVFAEYDLIVLGDGLEFDGAGGGGQPAGAGRAEHLRTREIIARLASTPRRTVVFGYIDLGSSQQLALEEIARRTGLWQQMGAAGVFFDEAGRDFGVTRARQNAAVDAAHRLGLRVIMNAFNPDDVLASDQEAHRLRPGDAYLLESFLVRLGRAQDPEAWFERTARAARLARAAGVDLFAVTTASRAEPGTPSMLHYAWWGAVLAGVRAFGWGEPEFSAPDSLLPWRARPELPPGAGSATGEIERVNGRFRRATAGGYVELDPVGKTGRFTPRR